MISHSAAEISISPVQVTLEFHHIGCAVTGRGSALRSEGMDARGEEPRTQRVIHDISVDPGANDLAVTGSLTIHPPSALQGKAGQRVHVGRS